MIRKIGLVVGSVSGSLFVGGFLGILWGRMVCDMSGIVCTDGLAFTGGLIGLIAAVAAGMVSSVLVFGDK